MLVYQKTKGEFLDDILTNDIDNIIHDFLFKKLNKRTSQNETKSWKNSMMYMNAVLSDNEIPDDSNVAIEYNIPQSGKRIDFILTGQSENKTDYAIIIELKQWSEAELTAQDAIVNTYVGGRKGPQNHPSYQAWSYAALLQGFSETVYNENIQLKPCAYLHNYVDDGIITNEFYADYIEKAPLFLKADAVKLRKFIKQFVKYGDKTNIMYRIDCGKIKPSKSLADSLASMLKGNEEFIMIDEQKIVFETALTLAKHSSESNKNILIVEGGPGTGKSVVAINLLVQLTKAGLLSQYVTKNAAPRAVYQNKLTGTLKKTHISNLFKGASGYHSLDKNVWDALVIDEAHRLNEKSGLYGNLGENQIKELIHASKFSVFFVDEDQKVTLKDIGDKEEITKWAEVEKAHVYITELTSQFRCNGSDGYLAWLDDTLQIRETANPNLDGINYEFKICDTPTELRDIIFEKNKINNKARMVAGYCWDWKSKRRASAYDIEFPEYDFKMRWNLTTDGSLWVISPESVNEIGCIHTCQGLEVDYVGVIVGKDLVVRNGGIITDAAERSKMDSSVKGWRKLTQMDPVGGFEQLDRIIKNTYRTLMTRGMKGCYVYFVDKGTEEYFKSKI